MQKRELSGMNNKHTDKEKYTVREYFQFGAIGRYILRLFGKKDPNAPSNLNLRMMHGINKISILMFLIALIVLVIRRLM